MPAFPLPRLAQRSSASCHSQEPRERAAASHERLCGAEVQAVDGGRHPVRTGGRRRQGRRRSGLLHEGPRHLHERQCHLLRLRGDRHPHLHVPPHGHLRAPHQAWLGLLPGLPRRRPRPAVPLRAAPPRRRLAGQAPAFAQDGARAGRGSDGADAGAAVSDVPRAAGASPPMPQRRGALAYP